MRNSQEDFFGVTQIGNCYQVTWKAFNRARHALMSDAFHAWWLATNVDLGDAAAPASVGRVVAALDEVDSLKLTSQEDRLKRCEIAVNDGQALQNQELLLVTLFWRGNVRRAMLDFQTARDDLRWKPESDANPWLKALFYRFSGLLLQDSANQEEALALLRQATGLYRDLDPHIAALLVAQQATVQVDLYDYAAGIGLYLQALPNLDDRRGIGPPQAGVPLKLAMTFALQGNLDRAQAELDQYHYDRSRYPTVEAIEIFTVGCIALLAGMAKKAAQAFAAAQSRFEEAAQWRNAAVTATYQTEAHCLLGDRDRGAAATVAALRFFEAAGCTPDTIASLEKLKLLVQVGSAREVAAGARELAAQHGGSLPLISNLP